MSITIWINAKTAAEMVGIKEKRFRLEWCPEEGVPRVTFRCTNGKTGRARRIEVDMEDLVAVLKSRICRRTG
jgi:hypothetical protein